MSVSICDFQYIIVFIELTSNETVSDKAVLRNVNCNIRKPQAEGHYRTKRNLSGFPKNYKLKMVAKALKVQSNGWIQRPWGFSTIIKYWLLKKSNPGG